MYRLLNEVAASISRNYKCGNPGFFFKFQLSLHISSTIFERHSRNHHRSATRACQGKWDRAGLGQEQASKLSRAILACAQGFNIKGKRVETCSAADRKRPDRRRKKRTNIAFFSPQRAISLLLPIFTLSGLASAKKSSFALSFETRL